MKFSFTEQTLVRHKTGAIRKRCKFIGYALSLMIAIFLMPLSAVRATAAETITVGGDQGTAISAPPADTTAVPVDTSLAPADPTIPPADTTAPAADTSVPVTDTTKAKGKDKTVDPTLANATAASTLLSSPGGSSSAGTTGTPQFTVSSPNNSGAISAGIPIEVPPGRGGIGPNLSLTYSSTRGNGKIGVGWDIDLGAIQRSTKRGLNYSANDYVFLKDGGASELVPRSGNNYGTKIEGAFSQFYSDTSTGGWIVTTKDGVKYYYGTTASSRQDNTYGTFKWCLDKVIDTNGNYMTLNYIKYQGEIYIDTIYYTGNTNGLSANNYVKFYYDYSRTDVPFLNTSNTLTKMFYRISAIAVYGNNLLARKYILNYDGQYSPATKRSLLRSVTQYGSDGSTPLLTISFTWQGESGGAYNKIKSLVSTNDWDANRMIPGDYNADGKTDFLSFANSKLVTFLSNDDGTYNKILTTVSTNDWDATRMIPGDYNADGKADFLSYYNGKLVTFFSNGDGTYNKILNTVSTNDWYSYIMIPGDYNGDGKTDFLSFANSKLVTFLSNGDGTYNKILTTVSTNDWATNRMIPGDYNADGKADFLSYYNGKLATFFSNGDGTYNKILTTVSTSDWDSTIMIPGDYNADGKADFLSYANGKLVTYLSYGDGTYNKIFNTVSTNDWYSYIMIPGDYNGDGATDFMSFANSNLVTFLSKGDGTYNKIYNNVTTNDWDASKMIPGDYNGDGKADILSYYSGYFTKFISNGPYPDLLNSTTNGLGGTTTFAYKPSSAYSNTLLPFVLQTGASVSVSDGNGNLATTNYLYSGGYFSYTEREYRGFGYVKSTAPQGNTMETWYYQDDVFKGLPSNQSMKDSAGNTYTASTNYYSSTVPYSGAVYPYLIYKTDSIYDGLPTCKVTAKSFVYDQYGNIVRIYSWGDQAITGDEKDEYVEYSYNTTSWMLDRPLHSYTLDSNGTMKAQSWFTYDAKGNLQTRTGWLNGGNNPVISYGYDAYGNLNSITDARNNSTSTSYEPTSYTYPQTVTNSLGHTTVTTYDPRFGKIISSTDSNANTTTYQYDIFGRIKMVTSPYGSGSSNGSISYYYENFGTVGNQKVTTYALEQSGTENYTWQESYFDGLGRGIKTKAEGPDGKVITTQTQYDIRGQVASSSLPYFDGIDTAQYTLFTYDAMGRVKQVTNPDGTTISKSYDKGRITTIDPTYHKKVEENDAWGRLIKVEEYTGTSPNFQLYATTLYGYDILGNLTGITDASGNQTTITYDTLLRKVAMHDPDMGDWTYSYDQNGNLISQTDAKLQTITFTYDVLNRLTLKDYPTGTDTIYTYDETWSSNAKGRLTTVSDTSGSEKYYYDKLGKTTKTVKTVDGASYTVETGYDAMGRMTSIKYPDAEAVNYQYDFGGNLLQVGGYATFAGYDALGQPATITYGNGTSTNYTYYPDSKRLKTIQTSIDESASGPHYTASSVPYSWVTANTATGVTGDDQSLGITLPFSYPFYGTSYSTAFVSSNGFLSFGSGSTDYSPDYLPNSAAPNSLAAGLWRDLNPAAGGCSNAACITYGSTSNQFAVSYNNVKNYGTSARQTFQIVLNKDGSIVYQYASATNDVAATSIGVENQTGTKGTAYAFPNNGFAVKFTPTTGKTILQDVLYGYDNAGNVATITDNMDGSHSQSFKYDSLQRLYEAQNVNYGTITYQYDPIGNMKYNSQVGTYIYPTNHIRPHAVSQAGGNSYTYDDNGNMANRFGSIISYDYDNRPIAIGNNSFVYDHAGNRVKKNGTVYIGGLYECSAGTCTKYIYAGGKRIAIKTGSTVSYYHTDHLGSSSIVTDATGKKVEEVFYYPFGATRSNTGSVNVKHKYTGQEEDAETGLYYYGARYYDAGLGRFTSADSIVPNFSDPQSLNRYSYCRNNPLNYIDPSGHSWKSFFKSVVSGFVGGAVFILSGGTATPILAGIAAGMASGATSAALNGGNFGQILQGAVIGGALGGIGGGLYSINANFAYGMLGAGAGYSAATGGWEGLANFGGGMLGGLAGASSANYLQGKWVSGTSAAARQGNTSGSAKSDAPLTVKKDCVEKIFNESIDNVQIIEDEAFVNYHGQAVQATTRPGTIYVRNSHSFWQNADTVLHEYYHVLKQWATGGMTRAGYLLENITSGYDNNKYEIPARNFADENISNYQQCLEIMPCY